MDVHLPQAAEGAGIAERAGYALMQDGIRSGIKASVNTAVNGGNLIENWGDTLKSDLIHHLHQSVCTSIGDHFFLDESQFLKTLTHAMAGGAAAELAGYDFTTGALSAAITELSTDCLTDHIDSEELRIKVAGLISATAAVLTGANAKEIEFSREIAESVRQYNAELHFQQKEALKAITQGNNSRRAGSRSGGSLLFT